MTLIDSKIASVRKEKTLIIGECKKSTKWYFFY